MSLQELKTEVLRLNADELNELAMCFVLAQKRLDPGWLERAARINADMDAGHDVA